MHDILGRRTGDLRRGAQERGLLLLIGTALLAGGVLFFGDGDHAPREVENRSVVFEDVAVTMPTFDPSNLSGTVNVNTATAQRLTKLPGIGEVLAARIVAYREEHGPFASVDALTGVSGIGPETVEGFRDLAEVESNDQ